MPKSSNFSPSHLFTTTTKYHAYSSKMQAAHRRDQLTFITLPTPLPEYIDSADIHTVALQSKLKLLSSTVPFNNEYKERAKKILDQVEALSGESLSSAFELKSDDVQELPMRLLGPGREQAVENSEVKDNETPSTEREDDNSKREQIGSEKEKKETEVESEKADDNTYRWDSFIAASYCWGSHTKDGQEGAEESPSSSSTKKHALPFSPALYQAFLLQRRSPNEGLWIDAFCLYFDRYRTEYHRNLRF
ncbi:uncharacterized protein LY89DRAFT_665662 [Mollisia scopiformis]|uniref:Heterokaryon incompatibility domain-containing protein n=1 Tax=Mollisia scopiformis TaxID=149040 RepID=A0A194XM51_MOLSC|nr:uncharacterized protein LY89DRAFT_665662 [Mollisia scopiformis]KUJ21216.1 hypothetical protein LY89DRAFT_665662 [Mollisia scopiformis]